MGIDKEKVKIKLKLILKERNFELNQSYIEENDEEINALLDMLFDLSESRISNLTYKETFIIRKELGILDEGREITRNELSFELKKDIETIKQIENNAYKYVTQGIKIGAYTKKEDIVVENEEFEEKKASIRPTILKEEKKDSSLDFDYIKELPYEERLKVNLKDTKISRKIINPLLRFGIETIGDLIKHNRVYLLNIHNFGKEKQQFIFEFINYIGLAFKDEDKYSKSNYLEERLEILLKDKKLFEDKLDRINREINEIRDRLAIDNVEDKRKQLQK